MSAGFGSYWAHVSETCLIRADSALLLSLVLSLPVSHSAHNSALNLRFRRQRADTEAELSHTHISCQSVFVSLLILCFYALSLSPSFPLSFSCEENIKGSESVGFTPHQSRTYTNITGYRRKCVLELWSSVDAKTTNYKTQLMLKPDRESERKKEWAIQTKESCKG